MLDGSSCSGHSILLNVELLHSAGYCAIAELAPRSGAVVDVGFQVDGVRSGSPSALVWRGAVRLNAHGPKAASPLRVELTLRARAAQGTIFPVY